MSLDDFKSNNEENLTPCQTSDVLSYKKIKGLLSKSAPRILVFCIIVAVIMLVVTIITLYAFTPNNAYVASQFTLSYSGIENGLDPKGGDTIDTSVIKSSMIVAGAISDLNSELKDEEKIDTLLTDSIITSINVERVIQPATAERAAFVEHKISLTNLKKLALSRDVALSLLNKISQKYISYFISLYGDIAYVKSNYLEVIQTSFNEGDSDYIDVCDLFSEAINSVLRQLEILKTENSAFKSTATKMSFADHITSFKLLTNSVDQITYYLLSNAVSKDLKTLTDKYKYLLEKDKITLSTLNAPLDDGGLIARLESQLEALKVESLVVLGSTEIDLGQQAQFSDAYKTILSNLTSAVLQSAELTDKIKTLEYRISEFATSQETASTADLSSIATSKLDSLKANFSNQLTLANTSIKDYINNYYLRDVIYLSKTPEYYASQTPTIILMLLITFVALICASGCAIIVTAHYIKKLGIALDK
ncbi:MAG: hypothetical protein LBF12_05240 [Christensenellaceae bacterium]|jgi:hypothetical protein|nr:hypothetical protein [Christensenellaceae bacterium]